MSLKDLLTAQQKISNDITATGSAVQTARITPVNAVAASVVVEASEIAVMNNDDTIVFDGVTFTKKASTDAAEGEFLNAAGLAACVNELLGDEWTAVEDTDVTITADVKGIAWNGEIATGTILEATTDNFASGTTASSAVIAADTVTELANGDTVLFAGVTFTKAAATDNEAGEFLNIAGLATAINELLGTDWTAAVSGDLTVTADDNTVDLDGLEIIVTLTRTTASGVNGTVGLKDQIVADDDNLYVSTANNTVNDANWKKTALSGL